MSYPQCLAGLESIGVRGRDVLDGMALLTHKWLGSYAEARGKKRWVDKTPNYWKLLPLIEDMFRGQARYIVIIRDPFDCVASLSAFFRRDTPADADIARTVERHGRSLAAWAVYWREVNEVLYQFAISNSERVCVCFYEELVRRPNETMARVLESINEEMTEGLIESAFLVEHDAGFEDSSIRGTTAIHANSVGRFRAMNDEDLLSVAEIVEPLSVTWGYEPHARRSMGIDPRELFARALSRPTAHGV